MLGKRPGIIRQTAKQAAQGLAPHALVFQLAHTLQDHGHEPLGYPQRGQTKRQLVLRAFHGHDEALIIISRFSKTLAQRIRENKYGEPQEIPNVSRNQGNSFNYRSLNSLIFRMDHSREAFREHGRMKWPNFYLY
jgi:beta-galactosidase GanA